MSCNICIPEPYITIMAIQLTGISALLVILFVISLTKYALDVQNVPGGKQ